MNVFLVDMVDFAAVNEVYDEFFTSLPKPVCLESDCLMRWAELTDMWDW